VAEELPGFWVKLKMVSDEASFSKGIQNLSGVASALKAIGAALLAGKVAQEITRLAEATAKSNITAFFAALDPTQLQTWALVLGRAGEDAVAFTSALTALNAEFVRLKLGDPLSTKTAKALGLLGLDVTREMGRSGQQRGEDILNAAQAYSAKMGNTDKAQQEAAQLVKDLLSDAGANYYVWMEKNRTSLADQMKIIQGLNFQTPGATAGVMDPVANLNTLKATWNSMKAEFASKFMITISPDLLALLDFIKKNHKEIESGISAIATALGKLAVAIPSESIRAITFMFSMLNFPGQALKGGMSAGLAAASVFDKAMSVLMFTPGMKKAMNEFTQGGYDPSDPRFKAFWGGGGGGVEIGLSSDAAAFLEIRSKGGGGSGWMLKHGSKKAQSR
jgi:hypothetical protein